MRTTTTKLVALGAAAALGLAACGGGDEETAPAVSGEARPVEQESAPPESEAAADDEAGTEVEATVDDPASTLRAELTALLQEHVHLTGLAVDAIVADGADGPGAQAAVAAIDESSAALGDVIAGVPSVDDPDELLEAWQEHVAAYVDYAEARVDEDDEAAAAATGTLEGLLQPMADFFEQASDEELAAEELFGELETHVTMVTDAIDARVAGDAEAPDLLREAALHMDTVAADLAAGIVAAHPDELTGDPLSVPAETRAGLTSAFVEHTYLTLLAAGAVVESGGTADDPAVQAATTALDGSADDMANGVSGAAGNEGRDAFLDVWRPFLTAATDYAAASTAGDAAAADQARSTMEAAPDQLTTVFQQATADNAPAELADQLRTHVANLTGAVDAMVAGDPAAYALARAAAEHGATIATGLAGAFDAAAPDAGAGTDAGGTDADDVNADPDTAAPDQAADGTTDAGTVGVSDAGSGTDETGPGAGAGDGGGTGGSTGGQG